MATKAFLGIQAVSTDDATRGKWSMVVRPGLVTGGSFLWGGCGLAAAVSAIEELSGRTCVWATAQYLSYARTGETMEAKKSKPDHLDFDKDGDKKEPMKKAVQDKKKK